MDDYYIKVLTLKEPSAQSFPLIFKRLLEVRANYYVVTEWKKEDSGKIRRTIQPNAAISITPSVPSQAR